MPQKYVTMTLHGGTKAERKAVNSRFYVRGDLSDVDAYSLAEDFKNLPGNSAPFAGASMKIYQDKADPTLDLKTQAFQGEDVSGNRVYFNVTVDRAVTDADLLQFIKDKCDAGDIVSKQGININGDDISFAR